MFVPVQKPFNLAASLELGPSFRWRRYDGWFYGVLSESIVRVRRVHGGFEFASEPEDEETMSPKLWDYFGLDADLTSIYGDLAADDRLRGAVDRYHGMRILRQEPWECLVGFICSANSNIKRISANMEDLADAFGQRLSMDGTVMRTFPSADRLAEAGEGRLQQMRLGYRAKYLAATSRMIADGGLDLLKLRQTPYDQALDALTGLPGVGDKVANCVLLFSLDKPEAFPVDVWVRRALDEWYLSGTGEKLSNLRMRIWAQEHFGRYAGYANQYLFFDVRRRAGVQVPMPGSPSIRSAIGGSEESWAGKGEVKET